MRFKNLDLNLLVLLSSMLVTRSVAESGRRLNLSQPAASAALSRLRAYFGDALFVSYGRQMVPTPFAENLAPLVYKALADIEAIVAVTATFDPANTERLFRIGASDYVSLVVVAPLLRRLQAIAPGVQVQTVAPSELMHRALEVGELDFIITPEEFLSPDHPAQLLFEENHLVVGWDQNQRFGETISEAVFFDSGHIVVEIGKERLSSYADRHISLLPGGRRVEVTVASFAVVPWLLPGTQRLAVMHERLARVSMDVLPLKAAALPFELAPMRQMVQMHRAREPDPGVNWFLSQLRESAAEAIEGGRPPLGAV